MLPQVLVLLGFLWLICGFALMALLTLTSTLVGWYNLRFISQVEKDNTQALIPTMNMARQLSEASAWELFAAQNLTSADNEKMWQAQGRMLTAQSLKINALLQALREQGFDTTAIEQQEQEISRSLRQQGELVGRRLQLRQQQRQLSQQIVAAADEIARLAQGQANNATTSAGATQAGIYDLIEQDQRQAAESALDRLIDIDLEYVNQMNELRLSALRVQQMVMNLGLEQIQKNAPTLEKQLNNAVKILQRRQIRIEDPGVRAQVATTLTTVSQYSDLLALLSEVEPHVIVLTGDLIDSRQTDIEIALDFAGKAVQIAPVYYVSGNHESRVPEYEQLKTGLTDLGVTVLENQKVQITKDGESITLMGIQDPSFRTDYLFGDAESVSRQAIASLQNESDGFTVLLSHRPELFDLYVDTGVDLVFSGHAHGGQFRLPFVGGLVAPNQGLFPKYDAGIYADGNTNMLVSRGVGNSILPFRINNCPEVIIIELKCT